MYVCMYVCVCVYVCVSLNHTNVAYVLQKNPDWWRHHNRRQAPTKDGVQYHSIVGRGFTASILEGLEYVVYKNAQTYPG